MASKNLVLLSITSLLLFNILSSQTLAQTPSAPPPTSSSGVPNITGILEKAGQYTTLIRLMDKNQLATQLQNQLNTSSEGLTLLASTDNAFNNLPSGTINDLTQQEQVELILSHFLTKYYSLTDFTTVSNPVGTQGKYGLNFTSQGNNNQLNVSSGIVETQINNALRQQFPLAVYQVDKVLLPLSIFGAKPPSSPPPPSPSTPGASNKTEADGPSATPENNHKSGSDRKILGAGVVAVFMVFCMGALF